MEKTFYDKIRDIFEKNYKNLTEEQFIDWLFSKHKEIHEVLISKNLRMNKEELKDLNIIRKWKRLFKEEFNKLNLAIERKESILFINYHSYSSEDIINSPTFVKLKKLQANINANYLEWLDRDAVSEVLVENYNNLLDYFEEEVDELYKKLKERKPTEWDKVIRALTTVREYFIQKLPRLIAKLGNSDKPKLLN